MRYEDSVGRYCAPIGGLTMDELKAHGHDYRDES